MKIWYYSHHQLIFVLRFFSLVWLEWLFFWEQDFFPAILRIAKGTSLHRSCIQVFLQEDKMKNIMIWWTDGSISLQSALMSQWSPFLPYFLPSLLPFFLPFLLFSIPPFFLSSFLSSFPPFSSSFSSFLPLPLILQLIKLTYLLSFTSQVYSL